MNVFIYIWIFLAEYSLVSNVLRTQDNYLNSLIWTWWLAQGFPFITKWRNSPMLHSEMLRDTTFLVWHNESKKLAYVESYHWSINLIIFSSWHQLSNNLNWGLLTFNWRWMYYAFSPIKQMFTSKMHSAGVPFWDVL